MATAVDAQSAPPIRDAETDPNSVPQNTLNPDGEITNSKLESNDILPPPPSRHDDAQPKHSPQHILPSDPPHTSKPRSRSQAASAKSSQRQDTPSKPLVWVESPPEDAEADASTQNDSYTRAAEFNPSHTMTVAHTRRNANGTIGSVYSGNKIRHLKKEDGVPLWRKDIQLKFLRCVFEDETRCFTKSFDSTTGHTFADIYVDAMARSSKTSKVLKEKLLADRAGAMTMAMICLLVNVGRMNTTLNCEILLLICNQQEADLETQSSQKCAPSCEPITPYHLFKLMQTQMLTSNSRMLLDSNPSSKAPQRTLASQAL